MRTLKHLPVDQWPGEDLQAFEAAYLPGDIFDETAGAGAHLADGTKRMILMAYRRWLGYLARNRPMDLLIAPAARITQERVRAFVDHLAVEVRPTSVSTAIDSLYYAARLIAPEKDWAWLKSVKARLAALATPEDRFVRLVPGVRTLDFGIELMDHAATLSRAVGKQSAIQYRDGLLLALLSLWPIRRRSIAALTISRHTAFDDAGATIVLYPTDTKARREESFRMPEPLVPYLKNFIDNVRPHLLGHATHDGLWASCKGRPLSDGRIYDIVRARIMKRFGKDMSLHDMRRSAATYIAMDAPEKIGLVPGVLQHASPTVGERHYNLARSTRASQRHAAVIANVRTRLKRPTTLE